MTSQSPQPQKAPLEGESSGSVLVSIAMKLVVTVALVAAVAKLI